MYLRDDLVCETRSEGTATPEVQDMFQLSLVEAMQADREREIAELIRQRRLLKPQPEEQDPDESTERSTEARAPRVQAQAPGS
jgi:hypothetical protein